MIRDLTYPEVTQMFCESVKAQDRRIFHPHSLVHHERSRVLLLLSFQLGFLSRHRRRLLRALLRTRRTLRRLWLRLGLPGLLWLLHLRQLLRGWIRRGSRL